MSPVMLARPLLATAAVFLALAACQSAPPPAAEPKVVERIVTQVVEKPVQVQVTQIVERVATQVVQVMVTPTPAVDRARAETLNIPRSGRLADPTNMNIYAPGNDRSGTGLHQLVYEYFFYHNLQTGEFIPWLAESYRYAPDFKSLTVKLRDGVAWSDGKPFTADDVVYTYDLLRKNPGMTWAEEANRQVASVEKVSPLEVRFNLNSANPRYHLNREAFPAVGIWGGITILPKHVWEKEADPIKFKSQDPVGTGPYKIGQATETAITLTRRDDWWGYKAFKLQPTGPKTVNFRFVGPETNVALALANNELDTAGIGILSVGSFNEVARRNNKVQAWIGEAPYSWLDPCPRALMVQNARAPFDKKEARWALSYMIDRKGVVALAYEGATTPNWGIWPGYDGNKPFFEAVADLRKQYPSDAFDMAKGTQMLQAAGVNPASLNLTYLVNADSNEEMKVSRVIADQLKRAGINVRLQPLSGGTLNDAILRGDYDLKLHSFCPGHIPENLELFHSKNFKPLGEKAPWYERNSFRYQNPKLDAIVDQMFLVPAEDTGRLTALYKEAMAIWLDDLPVVPVVEAPALVPFNNTYWTGWPTAREPWNMPVSWWATFNLVLHGYPDPKSPGKWVGGIKPAK